MATTLSFQIRVIKNQIAACLREIERGVKHYVDSLVVLETQLEKLESRMEKTFEQKVEEIVRILAEESAGGYVAKLWQKHGKNRIYVSKDNGRRLNGYGYIDIDNNWDCSTVDGWANHWATAAVREVIGNLSTHHK